MRHVPRRVPGWSYSESRDILPAWMYGAGGKDPNSFVDYWRAYKMSLGTLYKRQLIITGAGHFALGPMHEKT